MRRLNMQKSCAGCEPAHTCTAALLSHMTHQPELDGLSCSSGGKCQMQTHKFHHCHGFVVSSFVFSSKSDSTPTPDALSSDLGTFPAALQLSFSQPPITRTVSNLCNLLEKKRLTAYTRNWFIFSVSRIFFFSSWGQGLTHTLAAFPLPRQLRKT